MVYKARSQVKAIAVMQHGSTSRKEIVKKAAVLVYLEAAEWIVGFVQEVFVEPAGGSLIIGAAAPLTVVASSAHAGTGCWVVL